MTLWNWFQKKRSNHPNIEVITNILGVYPQSFLSLDHLFFSLRNGVIMLFSICTCEWYKIWFSIDKGIYVTFMWMELICRIL